MPCQIGIYASPDDSLDQWSALIRLDDERSPRDLLCGMLPFLKQLSTADAAQDPGLLSAWLTWFLVGTRLTPEPQLPRVRLVRQIDSQIDAFVRVTPEVVEVYRVDELLDWRMIASVTIAPPVEVESQAGCAPE